MMSSPKSLNEEHEELMSSFREYSELKGETGRAVSELLEILEPHFEKEQRVVMPLLGSLTELVSGEKVADLKEIASAQPSLLKEYEGMFEEHKALMELIAKADKAAKKEGNEDMVELLQGLVHHSKIEEEVLYPSALLAGTLAKCLQPQEVGVGIA
jgi:hemerythrin-like domain-containing protein